MNISKGYLSKGYLSKGYLSKGDFIYQRGRCSGSTYNGFGKISGVLSQIDSCANGLVST